MVRIVQMLMLVASFGLILGGSIATFQPATHGHEHLAQHMDMEMKTNPHQAAPIASDCLKHCLGTVALLGVPQIRLTGQFRRISPEYPVGDLLQGEIPQGLLRPPIS